MQLKDAGEGPLTETRKQSSVSSYSCLIGDVGVINSREGAPRPSVSQWASPWEAQRPGKQGAVSLRRT